ncbi:adenylate/guanylate cyclase domain-containing protein [Microvirga sp. STS02]|uniref:adenylate/guanylate cyclase domain-containing protein n=1 Tax=Hymenobacter negativus TaxID=2795026 RepID=UPI0018DB06EC|nr:MULTISPECIES: adenylate/guanylate cyclase domain-containing protein [Bacteria]MBH8569182.1 adenylate/guanylate cyclase domain-containing protein [Hymenobacter negativus]MBR7208917.1 adenylate/guanylate cyclase domain-containing protein [Microvirga sp. STS02]
MKSTSSPWRRPLQRFYWHSVLALTLFFVLGTLLLVLLVRGTLSGLDVRLALEVGGPVGLLVAALEVYVYPQLFARVRLAARLGLGMLFYLAGFWLLLFLIRRIFGNAVDNTLLAALDAEGFQSWRALAIRPEGKAFVRLLTGYGILSLFTSLLYQLSNKIGRPALLRLLLGRYHHPVAEQRIFLFVDVKGSTALAEELGNEQYSHLIRDFFFDMGAPIVAHRGEIYQYVGDEVVVTWEWRPGIAQARCVRCFFAMQEAIDRRRDYYLRTYGAVPAFKAGLHGGPVMATQVGAVKTELVFHGDVLNTTARIEAQCNALHSRLLLSAALYEALPHPPEFRFEALGAFPLRGKAGTVALYSAEIA